MKGHITDAIRRAVKASGMLQKEIAELAEIDPAQLTRLMKRQRQLNLEAFERVCTVLGLELRQIRPAGKGKR
jgi:transcriptional regulator with XRE-family HTH domain